MGSADCYAVRMGCASRFTPHASRLLAAAALLVFHAVALAEVGGGSVRQDSRPVSEGSINIGAGSGPVRGEGGSLRAASPGRLGGNSVRGSVGSDVSSGSVSDVSAGPVTAAQPVSGDGTVTDASAGAVKKDIDSPLGEMISKPLSSLRPLQEQLRAVQPLPRDIPRPDEQSAAEPPTGNEAEAAVAEPTPELDAESPSSTEADQEEGNEPGAAEAPAQPEAEAETTPEPGNASQEQQEAEPDAPGQDAPSEPEPTPQP
jgi:hypothetical protein